MLGNKLNVNRVKNLYWNKEQSMKETAGKLGVSFWRLYNFMNKNNILRRQPAEVNYLSTKHKPKFKVKENIALEEEKLKIAGVMLYWAEGALKRNTVDFANSNPDMIRIFLRFLREICGVDESRLRVYLYGYSYQDLTELKNYWHRITDIPLNQFTKPYIREGALNASNRKLPYGLVHIRYNDKKLLELIGCWIKEYGFIWAGTQAAKGDRLCKRSVMPKGVMEK